MWQCEKGGFEMTLFKIGDQVRRCRAVSDAGKNNTSGTITAIIESESGLRSYTMYDIRFAFGSVTLCGNQIEPSRNGPARIETSYLP
jgi:hypothetical protein